MKRPPHIIQLSNFKLRYELLKSDRVVPRTIRVKGFIKQDLKRWYNNIVSMMRRVYPHIERRLPKWSALSRIRVPISWIIIAFLLGVLLSGQRVHVIPKEGSHFTPIKAIKTISQTSFQPQATLDTVYVAPPAPTPVIGCGSDQNMAFIYEHESGCSTASINAYSGACGLGQALPCSKLPCSLSDWSCQNAYFTSYAISRYGSTYAAYLYWISHSWW